jgi:hypothetical protein
MNAMRWLFGVLALAGAASTALADRPAAATKATKGDVQRLFGITWQPDLDAARKAAGKTAPGQPIVLLRVLGKLDDKL